MGSLIICKCQFWREKKLFLLLNLANHLPQKLFCKLWFGWGLRVFFVGLLLKQAEPVTIPLLCPSRCSIMGKRFWSMPSLLPLCLFTHPPSRDVWQGFLRQFCPPTYYLVATHISRSHHSTKSHRFGKWRQAWVAALSTDVLWRTRCHDWRHKFPQISNWHRSPGSTDISQFLFFSKQKTSNKEHKTATRDKKPTNL